jgi:hypothetical protein
LINILFFVLLLFLKILHPTIHNYCSQSSWREIKRFFISNYKKSAKRTMREAKTPNTLTLVIGASEQARPGKGDPGSGVRKYGKEESKYVALTGAPSVKRYVPTGAW